MTLDLSNPAMIQALGERAHRDLARIDLLEFIRYVREGYESNWHHEAICNALMGWIDGTGPERLMLFMPASNGKSEIVSRCLPAFLMGMKPCNVIACSHTQSLANDMSNDVREIMRGEEFRVLFGDKLGSGGAVEAWRTLDGSRYSCAGIGGPVTGKHFHYGIIDDPVKNSEEAFSETMREKAWQWYTRVFRTRRIGGNARMLLTTCMVGSTRVLLADGTQKQIKDIRAGDEVASYDGGRIIPARVLNWANQGPDSVFRIRTKSGIIVTANERHPFLVHREGRLEWVRLRSLTVGDKMVRVRGARGPGYCAARSAVGSQQSAKAAATRTTTNGDGQPASGHRPSIQNLGGMPDCAPDMESQSLTMRRCSESRAAIAPSAVNRRAKMSAPIGAGNSVSITATKAERLGDCYATIAISPSGTGRPQGSFCRPLNTYETIPDEIVEISPAGEEDVFDIQVETTENFIANGLVSHNTRWHEDDLAGRILAKEPGKWHVLNFPAIAEQDEQYRRKGQPLWPARYPLEFLLEEKRINPHAFNALYQQRPVAEGGGMFKRQWFRYAEKGNGHDLYKLDSWRSVNDARRFLTVDLAASTKETGDYTVIMAWAMFGEKLLLLDVLRDRLEGPDILPQIALMLNRWNASDCWIEKIGFQTTIIQDGSRKGLPVRELRPDKDKQTRAAPMAAAMANGKIWFAPGNWQADLEHELLSFPAGAHDDQVDAFAYGERVRHEVEGWQAERIAFY